MATLLNDRQITISVGANRKEINWRSVTTTISDLYGRLMTPIRGTETTAEYFKLTKAQQTELKDVGGFVGGTINGGRRKASAIVGRDIVTLDFDTIPPYGTDGFIQAVQNLGYSYCVYSTRKHIETQPRLRVIIPLDRTVSPDEYEAISRRIAEYIGIQMADPTTFEPSRLMYWPSCSSDSTFIYKVGDMPLANADSLLASYTDWRNYSEWPQVPGSDINFKALAVKQGDPETKPGIVGAFNRVYDIFKAMDELLPGIYAPCDNDSSRFTYLNGSTAGGAVVYDNGRFLYSHHATDPCSGKLVNAFDLVRLHKFADMDDSAAPNTPVNRLPSYSAMCQFAVQDSAVAASLLQDRTQQAVSDFADIVNNRNIPPDGESLEPPPTDWLQRLQLNPQTGAIKSTIDNILIILENDPLLKDKFALNKFAGRGEVLGKLPWSADGTRRLWADTDSNGGYWYMERAYNITGRDKIDSALDIHSASHAFNEVQDHLAGLQWDGTARLDTLFIDYLGAEDSEYNRAVCRKAFTAAVARAMTPGCKYDNMLILCGPQGIGKSTILDKMSRGWFNDSIRTFEGKEASELLQGVWIVEIAELDAFRKTDVARIKQFLSLRSDRYRAAYGRNVKELPRCCVFFGTCNQSDFLQDTTGNRRFWPVDVGVTRPVYSVFKDLTDAVINQVWAEAVARWQAGETLYLSFEMEEQARERQEQHREVSVKEGPIMDFVSKQVPEDWSKWPLDRRIDFWAQAAHGEITLTERDRICALEVWCEVFHGSAKDMKNADAREINAILSNLKDYKRANKPLRYGPYGVQRGYVKIGF